MKNLAPPEWHRLFNAALNDELSDADREQLAAVLKSSAEARQLWFLYQDNECSLAELKPRGQAKSERVIPSWLSYRPLTAAAAGLVFGLFCATLAWAMTSPRAVATLAQLFELVNGGFENRTAPVGAGFPKATGAWSGDEVEVVGTEILGSSVVRPKEGRQMLRFVKALGEPNVPNSPASACDIFQLVDLRPLREQIKGDGNSVIELSGEFLDARSQPGPPLRFECHLYLFSGAPERLHAVWPRTIDQAIGSGAAHVISRGGAETLTKWKSVTARCVMPKQADFAVVQVCTGTPTGAGGPAPVLGEQFADDIKLTLKTQPALPVRTVQRKQ